MERDLVATGLTASGRHAWTLNGLIAPQLRGKGMNGGDMSGSTTTGTARRIKGRLTEGSDGRCRLDLSPDGDWYIMFDCDDIEHRRPLDGGGNRPSIEIKFKNNTRVTECRIDTAASFLTAGCGRRRRRRDADAEESDTTPDETIPDENEEYPSDPTTRSSRC
jgi:hypothetical protein